MSLILTSPRSIVAHQSSLTGSCPDKRRQGECYCWKAKYEQLCQSCHKYIRLGHCISHNGAGWTHTFCEKDAQRGLPSIEQGLRRARVDAIESDRPSARRRLTFEEEETSSDDTTPGASKGDEAHAAESAEADEESDEERSDADEEPPEGPSGTTEEQRRILAHEPVFGGLPTCVNALAGCGKTTTIAWLCNGLREKYTCEKILYLVFNKKNQDEAMESGKFPKANMEIRTAHAFVLRHYFGVNHMHSFNPIEDYALDDIIETLQLNQAMREYFPDEDPTSRNFRRKVNSVASYVRKTIHKFQSSDSPQVETGHVFWRIRFQDPSTLTARNKWRAKIPLSRYREWAAEFFAAVQEKCHQVRDQGSRVDGISYDGYMKVAQLERDLTGTFRFVIADEAQDLTPCQADLFWGDPDVRKDRAIYLFGDRYQMLYRFRGAEHSFYNMWQQTPTQFHLTGSFRFGQEIAKAASLVLRAIGGEKPLVGRMEEPGQLHDDSGFDNHGVVLCRTNQGIYSYLFFHQPRRWCRLDGSKTAFPQIPGWVSRLEAFLDLSPPGSSCDESINNESDDVNDDNLHDTPVFVYKDERFTTVYEIRDYIDDEGDMELLKYLQLLLFLKAQSKSLNAFIASIKRSFVPLQGDPDNFDGAVMGTVHRAKGLEFSRVLIYGDFMFDVIKSHVINDKRQCDEGCILYVAMSRAKDHLFLTDAARRCLDALAARLRANKLFLLTYRDQRTIREEADEFWEAFKSSEKEICSLGDIVWPRSGEDDKKDCLLALDRNMTEEEQRQYIRKIRLRYHPDRFLPTFGGRISSAGLKEQVKEKLNAIMQACVKILKGLRNVGEG